MSDLLDLQPRPPQAPQRPPAQDAVGDHAHPRRARGPPVAPRPLVHHQVRQRGELLGGVRRLRRAPPRRRRHRPLDPPRPRDGRHRRPAHAHPRRPRRRRRLRHRLGHHAHAAGRRGARPHRVHDLGRLRRPRPARPRRLDRHPPAPGRRHRARAAARRRRRLARPQRLDRGRRGRRAAARPPAQPPPPGALVRVDQGRHLRRRGLEQLRQRRLPLARAARVGGARRRCRSGSASSCTTARGTPTAAPPSGSATRVADRPPFPGAIAASHLRVYDTAAPDGLAGGTPHLHTACTEAYWVVAGTGAVQTLTDQRLRGGAARARRLRVVHARARSTASSTAATSRSSSSCRTPACPRPATWSSPSRPRSWRRPSPTQRPPRSPRTSARSFGSGDAARARRDLAVPDVQRAPRGDRSRRPGAAPRVPRGGRPARAAAHRRLDQALARRPAQGGRAHRRPPPALAEADADHLADASVHRLPPPPAERRMGCCGTLGTFLP